MVDYQKEFKGKQKKNNNEENYESQLKDQSEDNRKLSIIKQINLSFIGDNSKRNEVLNDSNDSSDSNYFRVLSDSSEHNYSNEHNDLSELDSFSELSSFSDFSVISYYSDSSNFIFLFYY